MTEKGVKRSHVHLFPPTHTHRHTHTPGSIAYFANLINLQSFSKNWFYKLRHDTNYTKEYNVLKQSPQQSKTSKFSGIFTDFWNWYSGYSKNWDF